MFCNSTACSTLHSLASTTHVRGVQQVTFCCLHNCSFLGMDKQSPCALHDHPGTSSSSILDFSCLLLTQKKKNSIPCICHTPWRQFLWLEMDQESFLFLHSGACLFDNDDGKMIRFLHTKLLAQSTGPSPSQARTVALRVFLLLDGVLGFFWDDFFGFFS